MVIYVRNTSFKKSGYVKGWEKKVVRIIADVGVLITLSD